MKPIRALIWCPKCGRQHIDEGEWATREHHKHRCVGDEGCGHEWTPLVEVSTVGVKHLEKVAIILGDGPKPGYTISELEELVEDVVVSEFK